MPAQSSDSTYQIIMELFLPAPSQINNTEAKDVPDALALASGPSAQSMIDPVPLPPFDRIFKIASLPNLQEAHRLLCLLLQSNICINVTNQNGLSPAGKLAKAGKIEAAELLRNFGACVTRIARGAAEGGQQQYAERLRIDHGADLNWIAQGAAQGNHQDYAEELLSEHGASVNFIARGAAQGGHQEYAETLRIHHNASVDWIAQGAAQGGFIEYAEELRTTHHADVNMIAEGAAQGGHATYAELLRTQHRANLRDIARRAAQGGNLEYAEFLRTNTRVNITLIAKGAAQGGHHEYLEFLCTQDDIQKKYLIEHALMGSHFRTAEDLDRKLKIIDSEPYYSYGNRSNDKYTLHQWSFLQSGFFRKRIAQSFSPRLELMQQAKQIHSLMVNKHLNYDSALALTFTEVRGLCLYGDDLLLSKNGQSNDIIALVMSYLAYLAPKDAQALVLTEMIPRLLNKKAVQKEAQGPSDASVQAMRP